MSEQTKLARIVERAEGERSHLWWDIDRFFPFLGTEGPGWFICPYCGGLKLKNGEKFIFPRLKVNEKNEDLPVEKDIGCLNFSFKRKPEVVKEKKEEVKQEAAVVEKKEEPSKEEKPEASPKKRGGILKGFRGK